MVSKTLLLRRFQETRRAEGLVPAILRARGYLARRYPVLRLRLPWHPAPSGDDQHLMPAWRSLAEAEAFHALTAPALLRKRRQIALIGDLNLPQCRKYRVEQLVTFWQARGVEVAYAHYADVPRATRILQLATHLIEYRLPDLPLTRMLRYEARRLRLPILYDIDDPLFSVSAYATYGNMKSLPAAQQRAFLQASPGYAAMMNGADAVSLSTPGLRDEAAHHTARPLFLRRNFADRQTLERGAEAIAARGQGDGLFRVAIASGSFGREGDLGEVTDALNGLLRRWPDLRLLILGHLDRRSLPADWRGRVERVGFGDYPNYLRHLARADCVLVPLADDAFNRCKSGVRALDAMAVGLPVIASDVGDLGEVVTQGHTGWLVRSRADWQDRIETLLSDRPRARHMGEEGRRQIERHWGDAGAAHVISPDYLNWVEG
ncbi:MAG: glycosyltransferase [Sulfitobacter sp.]|nr:glycosyltransferase [Sulfitobacter sp.]